MDLFTGNNKLFDLVDTNSNLLPVLNRFGIRPGFKDKTVTEVCRELNLNKAFFLALVNTYNNPGYFPEKELLSFSPLLIVDYLKKTHAYYIGYFLPRLESLLQQLAGENPAGSKDLKMIVSFYDKYKKELLLHIQDEEQNVFPGVERLITTGLQEKDMDGPISFESEHTNVEMKLSDLKNLMLKYLEPAYDDNVFNEFLATLFRFEKDIIDHARIEDNILVPQILEIVKKSTNA